MILADPRGQPPSPRIGGRATLDGLLRQAALRRPDATALIDPPDRARVTDGEPRQLSYAQADHVVSVIAGRLRRMGLSDDAIVGIQAANTVESVLSVLGVLRAGLIAMPLPLLWRRADMIAALGRVSANALIVSGRIGELDHYALAAEVAAEVFPVRHICGYGRNPPDGLIAFDDVFTARELDPIPALEEERAAAPGPAAHLAMITWDVGADGLFPVARSHAELIAGGLAVVLESGIPHDPVLLSTLAMSSFAGFATAMMPWLIRGGTLALHHPFDPDVFAAQLDAAVLDALVVPGPLAAQLAGTARLMACDTNVVSVWRAPERLARAPRWPAERARMVDVQAFGEIGLIAARRDLNGRPAPVPFGICVPRGADGASPSIEITPTPRRTVALRGAMVPRVPFPPEAERGGLPHLKVDEGGFVDTGYACHAGGTTMVVTAPPTGIVSFGGYRFITRELNDTVGRVESGGTLAVLPDALAGHRLAGIASNRDTVETELARRGANPLLVGAFGNRRRPAA